MCLHPEDQHNSLKQYFLTHHGMMLENHSWAKDVLKVQEKPRNFTNEANEAHHLFMFTGPLNSFCEVSVQLGLFCPFSY